MYVYGAVDSATTEGSLAEVRILGAAPNCGVALGLASLHVRQVRSSGCSIETWGQPADSEFQTDTLRQVIGESCVDQVLN